MCVFSRGGSMKVFDLQIYTLQRRVPSALPTRDARASEPRRGSARAASETRDATRAAGAAARGRGGARRRPTTARRTGVRRDVRPRETRRDERRTAFTHRAPVRSRVRCVTRLKSRHTTTHVHVPPHERDTRRGHTSQRPISCGHGICDAIEPIRCTRVMHARPTSRATRRGPGRCRRCRAPRRPHGRLAAL